MSHTDLTIYRTTSPAVLQRWHDTENAIEAWGKQVEAALAELGMGDRTIYYDQVSGRITGISTEADDIPDGWRMDRRTYHLVPRLTSKAGKAIGAKLDSLRRPDPRDLPGMPKHAFAGLSFLTCGLAFMGGALYAQWSKPIPEHNVDLATWERVKLSEYYAVLEAHEAAKLLPDGVR
ncbi:hypothetical protein [Nonomuraea turcica]|uniref:hypothetical protein n=1 Tax=Nonomuraea sp. G32 TaxID=3067274 RepID=UPI00273AE9A6|nr:hypothetical protein [Nonomuraea sp. G32]MDP4501017.1 hypothetical protein [Nonomuraea sp. G32]